MATGSWKKKGQFLLNALIVHRVQTNPASRVGRGERWPLQFRLRSENSRQHSCEQDVWRERREAPGRKSSRLWPIPEFAASVCSVRKSASITSSAAWRITVSNVVRNLIQIFFRLMGKTKNIHSESSVAACVRRLIWSNRFFSVSSSYSLNSPASSC